MAQKKKSTSRTGSSRSRGSRNTGRSGKAQTSSKKKTTATREADSLQTVEVLFLIVIGIALLMFLSNFGLIGTFGKMLSYFQFGLVGVYAYLFPVGLVLAAGFVISNAGNRRAMRKLWACLGMLVVLCGVVGLLNYQNTIKISEYFAYCGEGRCDGGLIGGIVDVALVKALGLVGAFIVLVILGVIFVVLITEKSVIGPVERKSREVYEQAREGARRSREAREAEKHQREEKKDQDQEERPRSRKGEIRRKRTGNASLDIEQLMKDIYAANNGRTDGVVRGHIELNADGSYVVKKEEDPNAEHIFSTVPEGGKEELPEVMVEEPSHEDLEERKFRRDTRAKKKALEAQFDIPIQGLEEGNQEDYWSREDANLFDEEDEKLPISPMPKGPSPVEEEIKKTEEAAEEAASYGEDGLFTPKEKIILPQSAKNAMERKPGEVKPIPEKVTKEDTIRESDQTAKEIEKKKDDFANYKIPQTTLLIKGKNKSNIREEEMELKATAIKLQQTLQNFGVNVTITNVSRGPSVTRYEIQPEMGTKVSKITQLSDDIKLNLAASDIRIEAPIPGKAAVGIEVPNPSRATVYLRDLMESEELRNTDSKIAFAVGKDIAGKVIVADIAKLPHMLIAGTTGSGKSVFTNSIIMSILFRAKPSEVRLIIVDPKVVEFGIYNGIPHLLIPVVTDPKKAAGALNWAVSEMEKRYQKFAEMSVRDLKGYNKKIEDMPEEEGLEKMPQIVIIIDELADLMMAAKKEVETSICRLAQLARAAGIHLIIATQRPSVDVVTGLIKANIPSRVALLVSSGTDSRTIIDMNGAEKLLGNGDMLFNPSGYLKPVRLQGAFVSDAEVNNVVNYIKKQGIEARYEEKANQGIKTSESTGPGSEETESDYDSYFVDAAKLVVSKQKASTSSLQRVFRIGFNRAARIMDQLADCGIVSQEEGTKPRRVLMDQAGLEKLLGQLGLL